MNNIKLYTGHNSYIPINLKYLFDDNISQSERPAYCRLNTAWIFQIHEGFLINSICYTFFLSGQQI